MAALMRSPLALVAPVLLVLALIALVASAHPGSAADPIGFIQAPSSGAPAAPCSGGREDISPSSGPPGTQVTLVASGLFVGDTYSLLWDDGSLLGRAQADRSGRLTMRFTVPGNASQGTHQLTFVEASSGCEAKDFFTVTAPPPAPPPPTPTPAPLPTATPPPGPATCAPLSLSTSPVLYFTRSGDTTPLTQLSLAAGDQTSLLLCLNTGAANVNGFDVTVDLGSALGLNSLADGADAKRFNTEVFKTIDDQAHTFRFTKVNTDTAGAISGRLHLATLALTASAVGRQSLASTKVMITSPDSDQALTVAAQPVSYSIGPAVIANISVPSGPYAVAVNQTTNRIYVATGSSDSVAVIDGVTQRVIASVQVGSGPHYSVAVNSANNRIYVTNFASGSLSVIDGATNSVMATVSGLRGGGQVAANPVTNRLYVFHSAADRPSGALSVSVIDGTTNSVMAVIPLSGSFPYHIAVNSANNRIYTNDCSNPKTLKVFDGSTHQLIQTISLPDANGGCVYFDVNPRTNRIYALRSIHPGSAVWAIDGDTLQVTTIPAPPLPAESTVDGTNNRAYVLHPHDDLPGIAEEPLLSVIDGATNTVVATGRITTLPARIAVNPNTKRAYVTHPNANTVSVLAVP